MITVEEAKELCIEAHKDQWRKPEPLLVNNILSNPDITALQRNNDTEGFKLIRKDVKYTIDINLNIYYSLPYSSHPIAVADMMSTDEEKIIAYLHDIIEDTEAELYPFDGHWIKFKDKKYQLPVHLYHSLYSLTHFDSQTYKEYIKYISKDKLAAKIKIADMLHNMSCNPSEKQKQKYLKALPILLKEL